MNRDDNLTEKQVNSEKLIEDKRTKAHQKQDTKRKNAEEAKRSKDEERKMKAGKQDGETKVMDNQEIKNHLGVYKGQVF